MGMEFTFNIEIREGGLWLHSFTTDNEKLALWHASDLMKKLGTDKVRIITKGKIQ